MVTSINNILGFAICTSKSFPVKLVDMGVNSQESVELYSVFKQFLKVFPNIKSVTTDNENKTSEFRNIIERNDKDIFTFGCLPHWLSNLIKNITSCVKRKSQTNGQTASSFSKATH